MLRDTWAIKSGSNEFIKDSCVNSHVDISHYILFYHLHKILYRLENYYISFFQITTYEEEDFYIDHLLESGLHQRQR